MNFTPKNKTAQAESWPQKVTIGRASVTVYRRKTPLGNLAYMVANYSGEKRRFDSYATADDAMDAAKKLARQLSQRDVIGASMTPAQSIEFASAVQELQPYGISLMPAVSTVIEAVKLVGDLPGVIAAAKFYKARNKSITSKRVADVVVELIKIKKSRGASQRYLNDLNYRLDKFAGAFECNIGNVTTAAVQAWLDGLKLSTQSYMNFHRVIFLLFKHAVARSYVLDNPIEDVETVKIRNGATEIYTPAEIQKLLAAADEDFLPCIAIGAFAGLRSAEIERLHWQDVDLTVKHIIVGKDKAKTASRRVVPIADNLAQWLAPYVERRGRIWAGSSIGFYKQMPATAKAAGISWKSNALRHSFASYRLAQTQDAAKVSNEAGNSPQMIHRHYKELVTPADAVKWFNVRPETPANVVTFAAASV